MGGGKRMTKKRKPARAKISRALIALLPLARARGGYEEGGAGRGLTPSYARAFASTDASAAAA